MAILATSKVLTLDYWKLASQLQVGDYVFDQTGKLVQVKLIQQYRSEDCYKVHLDDHLSIGGDQNLGFALEDRYYRSGKTKKLKYFCVKELLTNPAYFSIPNTKPLQFPHQDLPVPPFVFGYWFFNSWKEKSISPPPQFHDYVIDRLKDSGYFATRIRQMRNQRIQYRLTPTIESHLLPIIPTRIPNNYLLASPEQQIELLSGIICSKIKQYYPKTNTFKFSTIHYPLFLQVQQLVESLGHRTRMRYFKNSKVYELAFKSNLPLVPVERKLNATNRRYIKEIRKIEPQLCVHIETTSEDSTILVGEGYIACR